MAEIGKGKSEYINFILKHGNEDVNRLRLSYAGKDIGFDVMDAILQIECRKKTHKKLASFISNPEFRFPSVLAAEQATHQCIASFHATLIGQGKKVLDMTGGLGIDAISIALAGNDVICLELDHRRFELLKENALLFNDQIKKNSGSLCIEEGNCIDWLQQNSDTFDTIFIDPARRDSSQKRVFLLSDSLPDVVGNQSLLRENAHEIIIKASPLLDITSTVNVIDCLSDIILVCVKGECKEVLVKATGKSLIENNICGRYTISNYNPNINVIDLKECIDGKIDIISEFSCSINDIVTTGEIASEDSFKPGSFLYDPNSGIHKLRAGQRVCDNFEGIFQVGKNTDLFISENYYQNFPGRVFRIEELLGSREVKRLNGENLEVISRNFPETSQDIARRLKLKPGKDKFLLATKTGKKDKPSFFKLIKLK